MTQDMDHTQTHLAALVMLAAVLGVVGLAAGYWLRGRS